MDVLILSVLVLCGKMVAVSGEHCSYEDAEIVMKEWNHIFATGDSAAVMFRLCDIITVKYFEDNQASKSLFTRVNVADVHRGEYYAFVLRIYTTLGELINKLHSPEVLDSMLDHLANQHAAIPGVTQQHFDSFRDIFKSSRSQFLDEYNPDAWDSCMRGILYGIAGKLP